MSEQSPTAPPSRRQVFLALLGLWGAVFAFYFACFGVLVAAGVYGLFRSLGPAVSASGLGQPSQPPTSTPYQTPVLTGALAATATFMAESGGFIPAPLPVAATPAPPDTPLPTLAPRTVEVPQPQPTLAPRTTQVPLPGVGEGPVLLIYRVRPNDDGYVTVRTQATSDSDPVKRINSGMEITCERLEAGQLLLGTDQWAYCSLEGGYILSSLLEFLR